MSFNTEIKKENNTELECLESNSPEFSFFNTEIKKENNTELECLESNSPEFIFSSYSSNCRNNVIEKEQTSIENLYLMRDDKIYTKIYTKLETKEHNFNQSKHVSIPHNIKITAFGYMDKIILNDFPVGKYLLYVNNREICESSLDNESGLQIFNFKDTNNNVINDMMSNQNKIFCSEMEMNKYLHLNGYNVFIKCEQKIILNKKHSIQLCGYPYYNKGSIEFNLYPYNTHQLLLCMPTENLFIEGTSQLEYIFRINGKWAISGSQQYSKIKFRSLVSFFNNKQNDYMSKSMIENSINFSKIQNIELIILNGGINKINQGYYNSYNSDWNVFPLFSY